MKKVSNKDYTIYWKEKTSNGVKSKSFDVEKKNIAWHMKNLKNASDVCYDVGYELKGTCFA